MLYMCQIKQIKKKPKIKNQTNKNKSKIKHQTNQNKSSKQIKNQANQRTKNQPSLSRAVKRLVRARATPDACGFYMRQWVNELCVDI
jgi:hypothetical protein